MMGELPRGDALQRLALGLQGFGFRDKDLLRPLATQRAFLRQISRQPRVDDQPGTVPEGRQTDGEGFVEFG